MNLRNNLSSARHFFKTIFQKRNFTPKKILCYSTITLSTILALLGFFSTAFSFYIGDDVVRILLLINGLLFCGLLYYSVVFLKKRKGSVALLL